MERRDFFLIISKETIKEEKLKILDTNQKY